MDDQRDYLEEKYQRQEAQDEAREELEAQRPIEMKPDFVYVGEHRGKGTSTNADYVGRHHHQEK